MARWKCTPSACGISPDGGDLLSPYLSADLSRSTHSERIKSPRRVEGGGASHQKGCISSPAGRLYSFIQTGAFYNLEAPTTPLAPKGETTHYDLCVALLLQIMFAVHARGASNLSPLSTFGPAGRQPSSPIGACHNPIAKPPGLSSRGFMIPFPSGRRGRDYILISLSFILAVIRLGGMKGE